MLHRLNKWIGDPEQFILRRELRWTRKWLTSRTALICFSVYICFVAYEFVGIRLAGHSFYKYSRHELLIARTLLIAFTVSHLILRRILIPLQPQSLHHLITAPVESRQLWPSLLAAPMLAICVFSAISAIPYAISFLLYVSYNSFMGPEVILIFFCKRS